MICHRGLSLAEALADAMVDARSERSTLRRLGARQLRADGRTRPYRAERAIVGAL